MFTKGIKSVMPLILLLVTILLYGCSDNNGIDSETQSESNENDSETQNESNDETYKFRLAHTMTEDDMIQEGAVEFAESVNEDSDGRIQIDIYPNGQLGGDTELMSQIQSGDLDIGVTSTSAHESIVPAMTITNLPFLYETYEDAYKSVDEDVGPRQIELLEEHGIKGLDFWPDSFKQITNNKKPINTPDDLKGLKIRISENKMRDDMYKALGANPQVLAFTELYSALQQGVIDGQDNGPGTTYSNKLYENQKYMSIVNSSWGSFIVEMNLDKWNELPGDIQEILQENATKYKTIVREKQRNADEANLAKIEEEGMEVNYVEDLQPFKEKTKAIYEEYRDIYGDELMDLVEGN